MSHGFFSYLQVLHSAFSVSIYLDLEFPLMHELISIDLGALGFPSSKVGLTIKGIELFRLWPACKVEDWVRVRDGAEGN